MIVWQCNWHCYLNRYLDLQEEFGFDNVNAAFRHWFNLGQFEGRDCTCGKYIHRKILETLNKLHIFRFPLVSHSLNICHVLDQLDIPICDGCGTRDQECWEICQEENGVGNESGFCEKCNSYIGTKGACCMLNNQDNPEECLAVPESSFLYTTYHMCVLVPGNFLSIPFLLDLLAI